MVLGTNACKYWLVDLNIVKILFIFFLWLWIELCRNEFSCNKIVSFQISGSPKYNSSQFFLLHKAVKTKRWLGRPPSKGKLTPLCLTCSYQIPHVNSLEQANTKKTLLFICVYRLRNVQCAVCEKELTFFQFFIINCATSTSGFPK